MTASKTPEPEFNVTGIDYRQRDHFRYSGPPIIDIHAHVFQTRPTDPKDGPPDRGGPNPDLHQAEMLFATAKEFGVSRIISMCPPEDIAPLRASFGSAIGFNGAISKKLDEPDQVAYRLLDQFLEQGAKIIKFWSAPRGRERGLFVDAPWRIECARRARSAGVKLMMVHVADPDVWFRTVYQDAAQFGTKPEQYERLERVLEMFPDLTWIGAHMGGDPEHPEHLEYLLARYPHFYLDTSATKWQVREVCRRHNAIRQLILKYPGRFLFGSDLVTRHHLEKEHYVSRYWCQRTLWESSWEGTSPIADADYQPGEGEPELPILRGLALPQEVLHQVYSANAARLLGDVTRR